MALLSLARPLVGARWAAFAAIAAMASNLLYQYALQGNMKELLTVTSLATAAAVAGWSIGALKEAAPDGASRPAAPRGGAARAAGRRRPSTCSPRPAARTRC